MSTAENDNDKLFSEISLIWSFCLTCHCLTKKCDCFENYLWLMSLKIVWKVKREIKVTKRKESKKKMKFLDISDFIYISFFFVLDTHCTWIWFFCSPLQVKAHGIVRCMLFLLNLQVTNVAVVVDFSGKIICPQKRLCCHEDVY